MAQKHRYNVSLPGHVADAVEKHAKRISAAPTEYAGHIIKWWFGQGCPPVTPDESELRRSRDIGEMMKRLKPLPADFSIWKLDPEVDYTITDAPVEKALKDLGIPNLFAQEKEHDAVRITVAFDNHPTHWLVFNFFKGSNMPDGDGLSMYGYSKSHVSRREMEQNLKKLGEEMQSASPIRFSQIPEIRKEAAWKSAT
ncbi:MAG TPA: hypothetical protein VHD61_11760 [Lacunisphaera sp.]|nr:hypothetical protein [Lacunisphaera sp.]